MKDKSLGETLINLYSQEFTFSKRLLVLGDTIHDEQVGLFIGKLKRKNFDHLGVIRLLFQTLHIAIPTSTEYTSSVFKELDKTLEKTHTKFLLRDVELMIVLKHIDKCIASCYLNLYSFLPYIENPQSLQLIQTLCEEKSDLSGQIRKTTNSLLNFFD